MPDADLTPNLEAPKTDMPEELKEQQARASAEKTIKRLESRIRSLTEIVHEDEDGTKHHLREIVDEYIVTGGEEFSLEVLCERLGFEVVRVRKMIVQRDGNPNREPFTSILRAVERPFQKINLMKMRVKAAEIALHEPEPDENGIPGEDYHPKDKLAAMQRYLQLDILGLTLVGFSSLRLCPFRVVQRERPLVQRLKHLGLVVFSALFCMHIFQHFLALVLLLLFLL